jgi:hypothetical protein
MTEPALPFDPILAAIRFGTGLSPRVAPPASAEAVIARLRGPDEAARDWPIRAYGSMLGEIAEYFELQRVSNSGTPAEKAEARERLVGVRQEKREATRADFRSTLARMATSPDGLRERLALFWADHFTVTGKNNDNDWEPYITPFVEEAIRPHVAGRFGDMVVAVTTHPMMLHYLAGWARAARGGSTRTSRARCWSCTRWGSAVPTGRTTCGSSRSC